MKEPAIPLPTRPDLPEVLARVADLASTIVRDDSESVDRNAAWPERGVRALLGSGLGGLVVAPEHGGLGHGLLAVAQTCETLGRECASTALCFGMHLVGSAVLSAKGTPEQSRTFLRPICEGSHMTTLALSEPGTGSHFYLPQTYMTARASALFEVTGIKSFVTNGGHADSYVVSAVGAEPDAPAGLFSCVVIPKDAQGLRWGKPWSGLGMRGNSALTLELNRVEVPQANLLGDRGDQIWYVFEVVAPYFLVAMAGTYLGVAAAALEELRSHLLMRDYDHTGSSIARQPLLQSKMGALWAAVARSRSLLHNAAATADMRPADALLEILSAKAEVADTAERVTNDAMTIAGGIAYRENSRLARCLRDARAAHVMSPTTDLLRLWTGRAYLGLPLLSD